jgi:hypothetical protein
MPQMTIAEKKQAIETAMDHVFTDVEALIKNVAAEHAVINMGQELTDHFPYGSPDPSRLLYACYQNFYQASESDEMADGTQDEYRSWLKQSKKDVAKVQKKGLPLTPRNVRAAFLNEGPFAKAKK